jgi:hypothetical protein
LLITKKIEGFGIDPKSFIKFVPGGKFPCMIDSLKDIGKNGVDANVSTTGFQGRGLTTSQSERFQKLLLK